MRDMPQIPLRDGHALHSYVLGRGPTVVMVHGFAMHGGMWIPSILPLAGRYRFVMPDLRGFGRSRHVPHTRRDVIAGFADDLEDILDYLGERKVYLAGLSMGALTSMAFAARGGFARISGYANVDQAARIHNGDDYEAGLFGPMQSARFAELRALQDAVLPYRETPYEALPRDIRERIRFAFASFFHAAFFPPFMKRATAAVRYEPVAKALFPVDRWTSYLDCLAAYLDERHDFEAAVAAAHAEHPVPLTFLVGDASEMYPAHGQVALAERVRRASSRPDNVHIARFAAGHAIPMERPVRFAKVLDGAIREATAHAR